MGTALLFGASMLEQQPHCWQKTIDLSGDGKNNIGLSPQDAYQSATFDAVTVNALVVGDPTNTSVEGTSLSPLALRQYYEDEVIRGPNAFAVIANGYADYAEAMQRKLLRELALPIFGAMQD
jgi:hypothetical protein